MGRMALEQGQRKGWEHLRARLYTILCGLKPSGEMGEMCEQSLTVPASSLTWEVSSLSHSSDL